VPVSVPVPVSAAVAAPVVASASAPADAARRFARLVTREVPLDRSRLPFFFTVAFDGSQRFSGWLDALELARSAKRAHGRAAHFTFFVNTCYFDTAKVPSTIGRARSRDEVLVRRALAQIAVNEGHEIASHGVGHHDGSAWDRARWDAELDAFHQLADTLVFEPVRDEAGRALVPRFSPLPGAAPGAPGAACARDADCEGGARCADLGDAGRLCAPSCNLKTPCPEKLVCGAPMFREDRDLCLPPPDPLPDGVRLRPRRVVGFRAPYLGANDAMIEALAARGYRYDTSLATSPRMPREVAVARSGPYLLELGLAAWPGVRAVPMDYDYLQLRASGERMAEDYRRGLLAAFSAGVPFNVGHHFATWEGGAYARALADTVRFAAAGCPDPGGVARCPGAVLASFREVADAFDAARTAR
jgi:peptidoglycan/xylan/chitin deacetylase (PgdA/CDA1 family)